MRGLIAVFILLTLTSNASAQTRSVCDAILQHGIFDRQETLQKRDRYNITKSVHCESSASSSSSGLDLGFEDIFVGVSDSRSKSREFCDNDYAYVSQHSYFDQVTTRASKAVVSAWESCVQSNIGGASHYIEPSAGFPDTFDYKIVYTADGLPYTTKIRTFSVTNADCTGDTIRRGTEVDASGVTVNCTRLDRELPTTVIVSVSSGGHNLKNISLPKYEEIPPPDPREIIELCHGADSCKRAVGAPRELSGAKQHQTPLTPFGGGVRNISTGDPLLNATKACHIKGLAYHGHRTTRHKISCGWNYGLVWWENNRFVHHEVPICKTPGNWVSVINEITCEEYVIRSAAGVEPDLPTMQAVKSANTMSPN